MMKQFLVFFSLLFCIGTTAVCAAPRHNVRPQPAAVVADSMANQGIEAYSDTTLSAEDSNAAGRYAYDDYDLDELDDYDFLSHWSRTVGWGVGGVLIVIIAIFAILLFLLAPFIIVVLIIRYLYKRHKDRVYLMEKAMETGQEIPEQLRPEDHQTDEYLWKRGIRNTAIGLGLALMFGIWGAVVLSGVGVLVTCYGAGQMVMAYTSPKNKRNSDEE